MLTRATGPEVECDGFLDEKGRDLNYDSEPDEGQHAELTYYDPMDQVTRCAKCGHEIWGPGIGFCTNVTDCPQVDLDSRKIPIPYFEVIESEYGAEPGIVPNNLQEVMKARDINSWKLEDVVGEVLDYESSAYDSLDDADRDFREEYEINSFIDEEEVPEDTDDEDGAEDVDSDEEEVDYKAKAIELEARVETLSRMYNQLNEQYMELQDEVLGSDVDVSW